MDGAGSVKGGKKMDKKLTDQIREFLNIHGILYCSKPEDSYGYWRDFAVNIHRATLTANYEWLDEIIYPKIEQIFQKHDGEAFTNSLLNTIKQELERIKEQVIESASDKHMAKFVFDDCVIQKLRKLFQDSYYFRIAKSHLLGKGVHDEKDEEADE